jgi:hypothetical protein
MAEPVRPSRNFQQFLDDDDDAPYVVTIKDKPPRDIFRSPPSRHLNY